MTELQHRFHAAVAALQPGEVVSYAEAARRAGNARWARSLGGFLSEHGDGLPWWRVVHRDGSLSAPDRHEQRRRLEAEGVEIDDDHVVGGVP